VAEETSARIALAEVDEPDNGPLHLVDVDLDRRPNPEPLRTTVWTKGTCRIVPATLQPLATADQVQGIAEWPSLSRPRRLIRGGACSVCMTDRRIGTQIPTRPGRTIHDREGERT
jgi:hypothetical protein